MTEFKGKKVLVTGGSGFFASHIVKRLLALGSDVAVMVKYDSLVDNIRLVKEWEKLTIIESDLRNPDSLALVAKYAPDYVLHFAAYNHVGDSFTHIHESFQTNAVGTANLMEAYGDYKKFIYISTSEVYGYQEEVPFVETMTPFPTSPYAVGKYAGEVYAQMKYHVEKKPIALIRPFNCFGPYQSPRAIISEMIAKCLRGDTIVSTEGIQTRDFNYVDNLVEGVLMATLSDETNGKILNIGSGVECSIKDLILKIHKLTESKSKLEIGKLPNRPTEIWRMQADSKKAQDMLGWQPKIDLDEGLKLTIDWYKKFQDVYINPESPLRDL